MNGETKFLIQIVKEAANLITDDFTAKAKDDNGDLVTNFDFQVEKYLIDKLKAAYPTFDIVSEEYNSKNELTKNCFVIDPIDGTVNFAHNIPLWGIQVACIKNSATISSVIFLPKLNQLFYADETGAYLNDKKISVVDSKAKRNIVVFEGGNPLPSFVNASIHDIKTRKIGAACVCCGWVASGAFGAFVFQKDSVWDYVPGQFLIKQAGGYLINKEKCHIAACTKELAKTLEQISVDPTSFEVALKHK